MNLSIYCDTETGLLSPFLLGSSRLLKADRSPRSLSMLHLSELVLQVICGLCHRAPYRSANVPAVRTLRLWRHLADCCVLTSSESPREQPWGPSPRFCSFSTVSDLLGVNPHHHRPARKDSLCWRTSVSSAIPPALSATGMSCLNALPVELVSRIFCTRTFNKA